MGRITSEDEHIDTTPPASVQTATGFGKQDNLQKSLAVGIAIALLLLTIFAARYGEAQGPEVRGFLPIVGTLWAGADLLTAYLLINQFYLTGRRVIAWLAFSYGLVAFLTVPYLAMFPGVFISGPYAPGIQQISVTIWISWHVLFPIVISLAFVFDPQIRHRIVDRRKLMRWVSSAPIGCALSAVTLTAAFYAFRRHLPTFVVGGHFQYPYTTFGAPAIVVANAIACIVVLTRSREESPLRMWLAVAFFTALLDGALNSIAPARYSVAWYVGKFETLATSMIVLAMLLQEVSRVYRHMAQLAMLDPLTGLSNRRELEVQVEFAYQNAHEHSSPIAMLLVDVDLFKKFNDRYGHAAGDRALQRIATVLGESSVRARDVVARYGGEEFVVVLTDTTTASALCVAERIRERLATLAIPHDASATGYVTASIGIGFATDASETPGNRLFDYADRALYAAKDGGRDRAIVYDDAACGVPAPSARSLGLVIRPA